MNSPPQRPSGVVLTAEEYIKDFFPRFWHISEGDFWKLERIQSFQEEGSESWNAFARGDRAEAFRLIEDRRHSLAEYYAKVAQNGFTTYRARVVEEEVTPYLQWELHSLRQRNELGEQIRVVSASKVAPLERQGMLPEIVTLETDAVYEVLYNEQGLNTGAVRSEAPADVNGWRTFIRDLFSVGQDIDIFLDRQTTS
ncbi:hypothetical protein ABIA35_006371 [Catenulispora sp. MAP12-49]|uniref:DUF6879 family protein n=1 Tax=Catenulispora sp. MAP12-49 TaxID=3156302 RepID=UPI0035171467